MIDPLDSAEAIYNGLLYSISYPKDGGIYSRYVIASNWEQAEEQCSPGETVDGKIEAILPDDGAAEQFKRALK